MKRFLVFLFVIFFLVSGPMWAWADCFRHSHIGIGEEHRHGVFSDATQITEPERDNDVPSFHCPQVRFDVESINSASIRSMPKPQGNKYGYPSPLDLGFTDQTGLSAQRHLVRR